MCNECYKIGWKLQELLNLKTWKKLIAKNPIFAIVPNRLQIILIGQRADTLTDLEAKGTAYYDTVKDVFWEVYASRVEHRGCSYFPKQTEVG